MELSSPTQPLQSDDDLFELPVRPSGYETVETVPVNRVADSPEQDTFATLRNTQRTQTQNDFQTTSLLSRHFTQPTQLIDRSPMTDVSSPPPKSIVQVAASSPSMPSPLPVRKPSGILASAMAPPGTTFRRPDLPQATQPKQPSWALPDDVTFSSDSDREEQERNSIKPRTFVSSGVGQNQSYSLQTGNSRDKFTASLSHYAYDPNNPGTSVKRSADVMANAYGAASKRPRQVGPSRAVPVFSHDAGNPDEEPEMELEDIRDPNDRNKVRRLLAIKITDSVRMCYEALVYKKFEYNDAADYLVLLSEKRSKQRKAIDLTGSDDELLMTPAGAKLKSRPTIASKPIHQQPKKPVMSIAEKYSNTQTASKSERQDTNLRFFDTPEAKPAKKRTLIRGRKDRSPPPHDTGPKPVERPQSFVISDDSEDEDDSAILSGPEEVSLEFNDRILEFFNETTAVELADTAGISNKIAEFIVSKRPYKSYAALQKLEDPNLKPQKTKRKPVPLGERVADKVSEMLSSYDAVDFLVRKCESLAKPLANTMKAWGVDVYGKGASVGEINLTSLTDTNSTSVPADQHDSGLGTPISDDDRDSTASMAQKKGFIGQPVSIDSGVTMKDYQIVGINWLALLFRQNLSCILADDMGLGKTLQTIAFLAHLNETGNPGPHLIVVPSATLENWLKEFHRFCPALVVEPYYSTNPTERSHMRYSIDARRDDINVIITTYALAKGKEDTPWLRTFGFTCAIFDEGHVLKNVRSQVYRKLIRIQSRFRLLLTGTPLQNNLRELIGLLGFLTPKLFAEKAEELDVIFTQSISTITEDASSRERLLSRQRIDRARSMLTPFILRRKKWQVLKDLPKKDRKVEFCSMTPEQLAVYNSWLQRAWDIKERKARGEKVPADENSNVLMRLRQASIHPLLFRNFYSLPILRKIAKQCLKEPMFAESNPDLILEELQAYSDFEVHQLCSKYPAINRFAFKNNEWELSGKVEAMLNLLSRFKSEGNKTLIFSQFVMVLDILETVLTAQNIKYMRLDGSTRVDTRQDLIDEFTSSTDFETGPTVFMLSTKAGGAGINLATANRVIIFDLGFNPQDDVQAENRAHRIGQVKDVEVWRLITKDSVEEQIYRMGVVKLKLDREVARESVDDLNESDIQVQLGEGAEATGDPDDEKARKELEMQGQATVEKMFFAKLEEHETMPEIQSSPAKPLNILKKVEEGDSEAKSTEEIKVSENDINSPVKSEESNLCTTVNAPFEAEAGHRPSQSSDDEDDEGTTSLQKRIEDKPASRVNSQKSSRGAKGKKTSAGKDGKQGGTESASQSSQKGKKPRGRPRKNSGLVQTTIRTTSGRMISGKK